MNYLSVENLSKAYGEKLLFEEVTFGIEEGQKVALLAKNGSGKTTLLNILAGLDIADSGKVSWHKEVQVAYLSQMPVFDPGLSVLDAILSSETAYVQAVKNYELVMQLPQETPNYTQLVEGALEQMDRLQAWDFEHKVKEVLGKLNIKDFQQLVGNMSGGQRRKVALARVLIDEVDFLILDEPTNHLDIDMIEWMEGFLSRQKMSMLVVTHDRYFLDNLCESIIEIDRQTIFHYKGTYDYYIEKKAERENVLEQEVLKARNLYRKELEWIRRMPKARTTKSKARIDAFDVIGQKAAQKLEEERPEISVKARRLGKKILEINNLHHSFGDIKTVQDFTHTFKRGEKIGVVGPNGSGKSTFFKLILGQLKPTQGSIVAGQTIQFGYFSQNYLEPDQNKKVIEMVKEVAEVIPTGESSSMSASQFLTYFGFDHNTQYNFYRNLSGGEKRRLQLLLSLVHNPNFLIFDEPTNDLDIQTLSILEDYLSNYAGCLLIATHDRAFLDHIVDHLFVFEGGGKIKDYHASYTEFRIKREKEKQLAAKSQEPVVKTKKEMPAQSDKPKKLSYMAQRRLDELEKEIAELEKEKDRLTHLLSAPNADAETLTETATKYGEVESRLDELTLEWMEIQE